MSYFILKKMPLILLLLLIRTEAIADTAITIEQVTSGNNNNITVNIDGSGNEVDFSYGGAGNTVDIDQIGKNAYVGHSHIWGSGAAYGGDLDGDDNNLEVKQYCTQSTCGGDEFEFHILGDDNSVMFGQGYELSDSTDTTFDYDNKEHGGHFVRLDIHGDNNNFKGSQRAQHSGHEHSNVTYIYGDNNDVFTRQVSNVDKTINLYVYNDGNDVSLNQKGSAAHAATVTLSGTYGTNLDLVQQGSTAQSYILSQNCLTTGGCNVSVTQGQ